MSLRKEEKSSTLPIKEEALVTSYVFDFFCFCSCCKMWTSTDVHCIYRFVSFFFFNGDCKICFDLKKNVAVFLSSVSLVVVVGCDRTTHSFFSVSKYIYIFCISLYLSMNIYIVDI